MTRINEHLRGEREARRLTADRLAALIGVSQGALTSWERASRNPPLAQVERWAAALGLRLTLAPADGGDGFVDYVAAAQVLDQLAALTALRPSVAELVDAVRLVRRLTDDQHTLELA